jgi:hypothetical protein
MLHNFGGNRDLYGNLTHIGTAPVTARTTSGSTMVPNGIKNKFTYLSIIIMLFNDIQNVLF